MVRSAEEILHALEAETRVREERFRETLLAEGGPEALAYYDAKMKEIALGITTARNCWHSISLVQRFALQEAAKYGGRFDRVGKEYRHSRRNQSYRPIYLRTVKGLCAHELMAWDGGVPDPEAAAVITERGLFVLKHGPKR